MLRILFSRLTFVLLFTTLYIVSCSTKKDVVPEGIIEPVKMTKILVDIQITESTLMHIQQNGMDANKYKKTLFDLVFKKYQIKKEDFEKSFTYYSKSNIQLLDKIYADVITSLSQKQSEIKTH